MTSKFLLFPCCIFIYLVTVTTSVDFLSCNHTPHPQVCSSLMEKKHLMETEDQFSDFRTSLLKSTMNKFALTHQLASSMTTLSSFNERADAAWNECLYLLDDTISLLNNSISSSSYDDSQTWLSAAIANIETCKDELMEVDAPYYTLTDSPFMTHSLSESISNALAINKATLENMSYPSFGSNYNFNRKLLSDGYPSWVPSSEKKLLSTLQGVGNYYVVVAQDGSGNYRTITEAVEASIILRGEGTSRFTIHVNAGIYYENVRITRSMPNLMIVGEGINRTIVTGSRNVAEGATTSGSATFVVEGYGFVAMYMTIENTSGFTKQSQAVAVNAKSDLSIYYRCSFEGHQDTLYAHSMRQFYRECDIHGTIDFIFGDAAAVFQNCNIYLRKPSPGQGNVITAQGRHDQNETTGFSIMNSKIAAVEALDGVRSHLGRPWRRYSRTVVMKTDIDGSIEPEGWLELGGGDAANTVYYGEYGNSGAGSDVTNRVKWLGFHVLTGKAAARFTVHKFLNGGSWIAEVNVPYLERM